MAAEIGLLAACARLSTTCGIIYFKPVIASEQREQPNLLHGACTVIVAFSCGGLLRSFHSLAMTRKILKFARNYGETKIVIVNDITANAIC